MVAAIDLTGEKYGRLTVVKRVESSKSGKARWECKCSCGNTTIAISTDLRTGNTQGCGCLRNERIATLNHSHGLAESDEYRIWSHMKGRCYQESDISYPRYGGRGIRVCDRWLNSFENFYADMGPRPIGDYSIDRREGNGNYEPGNCRWATRVEQNRNRSNTRLVSYSGTNVTIGELAEKSGLSYRLLYKRIVLLGWSVDRALS